MEYNTPFLAIFGLLGCASWAILNSALFKKAQIYLPSSYKIESISLQKIGVVLVGIIGWLLISYSLMQPRVPAGFAKNSIEANDIFFVVDVSRSMLANDFQPNRLEAAKQKIKDFVQLRPTDRVGIIMFSEKAFTLLPLSTDLDLINRIIDEIKIGFLGSGTNIGDALGLAVARGKQSIAKNKVIILLTDGVSNVGNMTPIQAAEQAKDANIKIYTIGIGGAKNAQIPVQGAFGRTRYQYIPGGSIDLETLKKIATITNGKMFVAGDIGSLEKVLSEINKLEKTDIEVSGKIIYKELFFNYLLFGVGLVILGHVLRLALLREVI